MDKTQIAAVSVTLCIAILTVGIIVVLSNNAPNSSTPSNTPSPMPSSAENTVTPTATQTIDITYHLTKMEAIGDVTPISGQEFVLVNLTIVNNGYTFFTASINDFYFRGSDGVSYGAVYTKYNVDHSFYMKLSDGGTYSGSFVISPPVGTSLVGLSYLPKGYNIVATRT
jgi:hypothetical protein